MSSPSTRNAVIGQSGGPTSVINQSLVGLIREIRRSGHISKLLGARHGVRGIVAENFIPLDQASDDLLERHYDADGPHLIYVPEAPLSEDKFLSDVDRIYKKHGRCLIAVSEGIITQDGKTWFERMKEGFETDSFGNVQLSGSGALGDY